MYFMVSPGHRISTESARFFSAFDSGNLAGAQFARLRPAEAVSKKATDGFSY